MNIRGTIKLTLDLMCRNWMIPLLLFLMGFIALYMVDSSMSDYFSRINIIQQCEEPFQENISRVHYIGSQYFSKTQHEPFVQFQEGLSGIENIDYFGSFVAGGIIWEEQRIDIIITDRSILPLSKTSLTQNDFKLLNSYNGKLCPVFVGAQLEQQFPVGTEFSLYDTKENDCIVLGVLAKGAQWIKKGPISASTSSIILLDQQILVCPVNYDTMMIYGEEDSEMIYYVCDEENKEKVTQDIYQLARKCNYAITLNDIKRMIDKIKMEYGIFGSKKFYAAVLLLVLAIISMTTAKMAISMYHKRDYGIMYAMGITLKEISQIVIIENTLVVFVSGIAAWFVRRREIMKLIFIQTGIDMEKKAWNVSHNFITPFILLGCGIIMVAVPSIILIYKLRKENPAEMIEQKE